MGVGGYILVGGGRWWIYFDSRWVVVDIFGLVVGGCWICFGWWWVVAQFSLTLLTHVDTRQLPRQIPAYIEKKHYHLAKKLPTSVLYGTQMLYFNPVIFRLEHLSLVENTNKQIHFQDHIQEINALLRAPSNKNPLKFQ